MVPKAYLICDRRRQGRAKTGGLVNLQVVASAQERPLYIETETSIREHDDRRLGDLRQARVVLSRSR
jgi:hypothetical protein